MTKTKTVFLACCCLLPGIAAAQPLDSAQLTKQLGESWPTYSGDYSGKRYSSLKQINQSNVKNLTLAWTSKVAGGAGNAGGGGGRGGFGAGNVWIPGSYDPETHLYIFGTGNPSPAYTNPASRAGDNLYTCSIVAVNADTGKMAWYYQVNPHDTHDWDSTETPVLVDGDFNGKPRKMVLHADRNGCGELGERSERERPAGSESRQGFPCPGISCVAEQRRRD